VSGEYIFIVLSGAVAALLGVGALVAVARSRPAGDPTDDVTPRPSRGDPVTKYEGGDHRDRGVDLSYGTALRVLWWVSILGVMVGVGLTHAYDATQPAIFVLGAVAAGVVVVLYDLLPPAWRGGPVASVAEAIIALTLATALLALTGYGTSPFVYGYHLVAVAVALSLGGQVALAVAALGSLAYLGVLALDPRLTTYVPADYLRFGLNIGSVWLLAYVAGVFASGERRMRATVLQLSRTDALTGLFNRGQLFPTLEQEVQRTRRSERGFCLLMVDLDGLKTVNDSFGHHRGDDVLRSLGAVIRRSIRLVDTAYRYGGDEFLVLLPETDFTGAFVVAEKIRSGAEELGLAVGGGELLTSVSVGLVSCPEDGTSAEDLMIAADRAMYQAKSLGKNQVSGNPRPRRLPLHEPAVRGEVAPQAAAAPDAGVAHVADGAAAAEVAAAPEPETATVAEPIPSRAAFTVAVDAPPPVLVAGVAAAPSPAAASAPAPAPAAPQARPARAAGNGAAEGTEDDEPDPHEVRRNIAAARLNMDPDHQIRRAMDAFLSPETRESDGE
jgi:diguanylate cyclase (GGDEF)-like protein